MVHLIAIQRNLDTTFYLEVKNNAGHFALFRPFLSLIGKCDELNFFFLAESGRQI